MKKVLFVATVFRFLNFEISDMKILKEMGYEIHTATNMYEAEWLQDDGSLDYLKLHKHQIDFGRSPFLRQNFTAYHQLKKIIKEEKFELMHCHTPVAAAIARLAACKAHKRGMKVMYTSHGFHFHKTSSKKNWILFYPIEWIMAFFTDMIITINREDYRVIQRFYVKEKCYIPGVGVNTESITKLSVDKNAYRKKYNIPINAFLILSIGELSDRKNHEVIIRAIAQCKSSNIYYLICGIGEKKEELKKLCIHLGVSEKINFAGQLSHDEVLKLCHVCEIGALPSKIEGLGLAGIETMAAGKPIIGSNVHGIKDYIIDGITGITCEPNNVNQFANAIDRLHNDKEFYMSCANNALPIAKQFDIAETKKAMERNYHFILSDYFIDMK